MRQFVIGDIHGSYKALRQCLERSPFNPKRHQLIVLGDVCDRHPDVRESIDFLMSLRHCVNLLGNHDQWALEWAREGRADSDWVAQGGEQTITSYDGGPMPESHIAWLESAKLWHVDKDRLFVHAGFDPDVPMSNQEPFTLIWDRHLVLAAAGRSEAGEPWQIPPYKDIFVGHTTTCGLGSPRPIRYGNLWLLDTGAGWSGALTVMDTRTKEFWQSDPTSRIDPVG